MTDTYVTFNGATASVDDLKIDLGDRVKFSGYGECVKVGTEKRADGEQRPVVTIKVEDVEVGDIDPAPIEDQLPFDEAADDLGDDEDDEPADDEDDAG